MNLFNKRGILIVVIVVLSSYFVVGLSPLCESVSDRAFCLGDYNVENYVIPDNAKRIVNGYCDHSYCVECIGGYSWTGSECVQLVTCGTDGWGDGCVNSIYPAAIANGVLGSGNNGGGATILCQQVYGSSYRCIDCYEGYAYKSPSEGCKPEIKPGSCSAAGGECVEKCYNDQIEKGYPYTECNSYNKVCCCGDKFLNDDKTKCILCNPGTCKEDKYYCELDGSEWISFTKSDEICDDGIDNDCDGEIDRLDFDCITIPTKTISRKCYTGLDVGIVDWCILEDPTADTAECHEPLYGAVYNGICYEKSPFTFTRIFHKIIKDKGGNKLTGDDKSAFSANTINGGIWYDCDKWEQDCRICSGFDYWNAGLSATNGYLPKCGGDGTIKNCWIKSGEDNIGEYPTKGAEGCCGDDDNEYYITASWPDSDAINQACCNEASDCVDKDGTCVSQGEQNKAKTHSCVGYGGWLVSCPNADGTQIGTRNAGCHAPLSAKYGDEVLNKYCGEGVCWQCIEGAEWDGNDCVGSKSDWNNNKGVCKDAQKCYCKKGVEGCLESEFTDADQIYYTPSEEKGATKEGLCVESDQYTDDHYCEDGEWTTRTKYLAQAVLNAGNYNDYIFFCGDVNNHRTCILKSIDLNQKLIVGALLDKDKTREEYFADFFFGKNTGIETVTSANPGTDFKDFAYSNLNQDIVNVKTKRIGHDEKKNIVLFSNDLDSYTSVGYNGLDKFNKFPLINIQNLFLFKKNNKDIQIDYNIIDLSLYYKAYYNDNIYTTTTDQDRVDQLWQPVETFAEYNIKCMDKTYQFKQIPEGIEIPNEFLPDEYKITEGCCLATQCWNGNGCTDDKGNANIKGKNYICVDGEWLSSKTAIIAGKLLDFVSGNYVLHCDKYDGVLRNPDDVKNLIDSYEPNVCVLRYGDNLNEIALGIIIEKDKNNNFLNKIEENCNKDGSENKFLKCNNKLWFNPLINSYIYNKNEIPLEGNVILQNVIDFFKNLFDRLFGTEEKLDSVKLYKSKIDGKEIEGFKKENNFVVNYKGFGNLCSKITENCYYTANEDKTVITSTNMDKWNELTVEIRVKTSS